MKLSAADVARDFLAVVWDGAAPDDKTLSRALDRLLAQAHEIPFGASAETDREPPAVDGPALYRAAAERFPDYGLYPISDPLTSISDQDRLLADAIDDIADITRDLREVLWRDAHLGARDAEWCFRLLFFHWAAHARHLATYLHARQFG